MLPEFHCRISDRRGSARTVHGKSSKIAVPGRAILGTFSVKMHYVAASVFLSTSRITARGSQHVYVSGYKSATRKANYPNSGPQSRVPILALGNVKVLLIITLATACVKLSQCCRQTLRSRILTQLVT